MSTTSPPSSSNPPPPQPAAGKKPPSKSKSEWLAPAILTARTITAAAECAPFPYITGVSGTVLILLETVQKVKKNREDLKELCNSTTEIVTTLHDQLRVHGNTAAVKFKDLCEELESYLAAVICAVQSLHNPSKGFRERFKEFIGSSNITDEIAAHQKQIQGVCSKLKLLVAVDTNLKVDEIHAVVTAPNFVIAPAVQSINSCPPPSQIFQGRQTILAKMHQLFTPDSGKQLIYVLHGLGGAGKTQIALKFIQESLANFSDIFFVDASTLDTIETGLKNIAASKFGSAQNALKWLQSKQEQWLLFFDNADDPKIKLNTFFPQCHHGNIIITSRNPGLRVYGEHSPVSNIDERDGATLLLRSACREQSEKNLSIAAEIVKELYYLPLAIVQAGSFILQSEDLEGYLALYQKKPSPAAHTASQYRFPSWLPANKQSREPLEFLAHFLDPTGEWNSLSFLEVTNEIKAYSLISFDAETKMFSIHPLVHAWSRSTVFDEGSSRSCISSILGMSIEEIPENERTLAALKFLPHVGSLKPFIPDAGVDFRAAFWNIYMGAGKLKEAQDLIEQTFERYRLLFGEEHQGTLEAMHRLAVTYRLLGEYKKAEELEIAVLEKRTKLLGEDHPDTLMVMGNLARTHSKLGNFQKAKKLEVSVLGRRTKLLGNDHPDTLMAMGNLAVTHSKLGAFREAKQLEVRVLERRNKLLGKDHPATLTVMGNLAGTHSELGDFGKAKDLEVLVLKKRTKLLGADHPATLLAMGNLARTYSEQGDFRKAKELEVTVLGKTTELLGNDHPDSLRAMGNLAVTLSKLGDFRKAKKLEVMVLAKTTKLLGNDHPDTVRAMGNLARTHSKLGKFEKAKELEVVVVERRTKLLGADHRDTMIALGNLAATHSELGEFGKAKELEVLVLEKWTRYLGENHPDTWRAMANLAVTYSKLREFTKAEQLNTAVLEKRIKILGGYHPETLLAIGNLAQIYLNLGKPRRAEELEVMVLEKRTELLGGDHPDTLIAMANIAVTYWTLGEFKKAEELEVLVLEKRRKLLGDQHPDTILAMQNLACTYGDLDKLMEAGQLSKDHEKLL
ncbi:hypothetical protein C8F04DRAFT_1243323 [Mycena alexandri]|uniref:Kinesin light chain n=1 Tax=Mycena alexandri TaxID=1745969 RepID=A0AAD6RZJ0_9AGAR|nr:hypothetical protein C8F04DRAFT_1243323 [Mycena alexandri]